MTVYADGPFGKQHGKKWEGGGHLVADTLQELHEFAERLGMRRSWFQEPEGKPHPHYDLTRSKRMQAIAFGAKPISLREGASISFRCK